ncbi:hypothetical protein B0A52_06671 [Exophiala mesophila]|uniref:Uncharacterized protein n=1 Tax=Exophiala mesophila TaxID=212818 RepID=A0A438N1N6_EXOME|nr:hypothetical protein B0A52_06671 [Exophiala mesophila]
MPGLHGAKTLHDAVKISQPEDTFWLESWDFAIKNMKRFDVPPATGGRIRDIVKTSGKIYR